MIPNMRNIKRENEKNNKHKKFRKISVPNHQNDKHIENPFSGEFKQGKFRNNIYFSINPAVIAWTYIKYILLYALPALAIHGFFKMLDVISNAVTDDNLNITYSEGGFQILIIAYAIGLFFALRKVSDHMAYYNITMLVSKYDINQKLMTMVYRSTSPENVKANKEFTVMDHYRKKFNKYSLFPSVKEMAVEEQLYQEAYNNKHSRQTLKDYVELRRERLDLMNKRDEHFAAKEIADWKQEQFGGVNEYDEMVKRYKHRTVPAIQQIIRDVQNNNF